MLCVSQYDIHAEDNGQGTTEDYYAKENAIYSVDATADTNNQYINEVNEFINKFFKENGVSSLEEMTFEQNNAYFLEIEKIKQRIFGSNRVQANLASTVSSYSGMLFIETESSTDKLGIAHGHAGIGDYGYLIEANPDRGVTRINAEQRINEHFHKTNGRLYDTRYSGKQSNSNYKAAEWARYQVGKGYDFNRNDDSGYFCSELVNEAWGRGAGKYLVNVIYYVSPLDLEYSGLTYFIRNL